MSFFRQLVIYGIAGAASRLAAIVLVPLYTRTLSVAEYGTFEVLLAVYALGILLSGWQSESALARDYHEASAEGWQRELTWSAIGITAAGFAIICALVGMLTALGAVPGSFAAYLPWLLVLLVPAQLVNLQLILLRFSNRSILFATLSFADLVVSAVATILFIVYGRLGIQGAFAGLLVGKGFVLIAAWGVTFGRFASPLPLRGTPLRMLRYGTPILFPVLLNWAQSSGSRILLALLLTLNDVAILGLALKIAVIFEIAALSFRQAWDPYAFGKLGDPAVAEPLFRRAMALYVLAMAAAAGGLILVAPLVTAVLAPPQYAPAAALTGFFVIGQFWQGAVSILAMGIHGSRRTSRIAYSYSVGAMINIATLVTLSRFAGVAAAGVGALASGIVTALLAARYSERTFHIRFDWRLLILTAIATAGFTTIVYVSRVSAGMSAAAPLSISTYVAPSIAYVLMMSLLTAVALPRAALLSALQRAAHRVRSLRNGRS
jgi:O-antigen/teichoic acid export membrane protein